MPSDLIYREDAKDFVRYARNKGLNPVEHLDEVPPADVVPLGEYNHLLKLAKAMHTWIFLHTSDEQKTYDECHLTDEDNAMLGCGGQFIIKEGGDKYKNET